MNVAIIPARAGSSRIPYKNVKDFHGKKIIEYPIETAKESELFSNIIVYSNDSEALDTAIACGVNWMVRDDDADSTTGTQDAGRNATKRILEINPDVENVCIIYPCSPMLSAFDLQRGFAELNNEEIDYAFSVGTVPKLHDAGNFYWCKVEALMAGEPLFAERAVMIPIDPERTCDINTIEDWAKAEKMYEALGGKNETK